MRIKRLTFNFPLTKYIQRCFLCHNCFYIFALGICLLCTSHPRTSGNVRSDPAVGHCRCRLVGSKAQLSPLLISPDEKVSEVGPPSLIAPLSATPPHLLLPTFTAHAFTAPAPPPPPPPGVSRQGPVPAVDITDWRVGGSWL